MDSQNPEELKAKITALENRKSELIDKITRINRRIRYKEYEKKALEPFLEKTKDVLIDPIKRRKRIMEFKIATQAYTPQIERELVKEVKKIDSELEKIKDIDRARRKIKYVSKDIEDMQKEAAAVEEELKKIREELKVLYKDIKTVKQKERKTAAIAAAKKEELVSLGDMISFEQE